MGKRKAPPSVLAIAIVQFVLAACCLCAAGSNTLHVVAAAAPADPKAAHYQQILDRSVPLWRVYRIANVVLSVVVMLGLAIGAVGLVLLQPWGRISSMLVALFLLVRHTLDLIYTLAFLLPASNRFFNEMVQFEIHPPPGERNPEAFLAGARIGFLFGTGDIPAIAADAFGILIALVLLGALALPSVRKACRASREPARLPPPEEDDDDYSRPWREARDG